MSLSQQSASDALPTHTGADFESTNLLLSPYKQGHWLEIAEQYFPTLPAISIDTNYQGGKAYAELVGFFARYLLPDSKLLPEDMRGFINSSSDEQEKILVGRLMQEDPFGAYVPNYMQRKARNIISNYVTSLRHLAGSLIEESQARFSAYQAYKPNLTFESVVIEVLGQQLMAIDTFQMIAKQLRDSTFEMIEKNELTRNKDMLSRITEKLQEAAIKNGLEVRTDAAQIHKAVADIWSMITSNQPLVTPDINYRSYSMRKPGASRSLFAHPTFPMYFHSSPVASYMTYTEVPIVTDVQGEARSFGFLNFVNIEKNSGQGYVLERPHYMHSARIISMAELVPNAVERLLSLDALSEKNHDLWHHMVQVFADHFQIHHDSAPLTNGGYKSAYIDFARAMRSYRESYELSASIGHLDLYLVENEQGEPTPELKKEIALINDAFVAATEVKAKLIELGRPADAQLFVDYVCSELLGGEFSVLGADTPARKDLQQKIAALSPSPIDVHLYDIVALLDGQKFLNLSAAAKEQIVEENLMQHPQLVHSPNVVNWRIKMAQGDIPPHKEREYINGAFYDVLPYCGHEKLAELYNLRRLDRQFPEVEYGAETVVTALQEMNLLVSADAFPVMLRDADFIRWRQISGEIQPALKGMSEKILNLRDVPFGESDRVNLFDLAVRQQAALEIDGEEYAHRIALRSQTQQTTHALLNLFSMTHQSSSNSLPDALYAAHNHMDSAEKAELGKALKVMDVLIERTFNGALSELTEEDKAAFGILKRVTWKSPHPASQEQKGQFMRQIDSAQNAYAYLVAFAASFPRENIGITATPGHPFVTQSMSTSVPRIIGNNVAVQFSLLEASV